MSESGYDALAPHYAEYARRRSAYCESVDRRILAWQPARTASMLDIGSGDGRRAQQLSARLGATRLVFSDPSEAMARQCRSLNAGDVWTCAAEDLPSPGDTFDVVTCLWNVLGHVDGSARRQEALRRIAALLSPEGRLFVDVHNRYNVTTAGVVRVAARVWADTIRPSDANGTVHFHWDVAGQRIAARGYLFARHEMRHLIAGAGLRVAHEVFVDYADGRTRGRWTGQLLLAAERGHSLRF